MKLNWNEWIGGIISAIANGVLTALAAVVIIPGKTVIKDVLIIGSVPMALSFFSYLKEHPVPKEISVDAKAIVKAIDAIEPRK